MRTGRRITIAEESLLAAVQRAARDVTGPQPLGVHLKIDTGLRRYGAFAAAAIALAKRIERDPYLRLASVFTHFASSDEPGEPFTAEQSRRFSTGARMSCAATG